MSSGRIDLRTLVAKMAKRDDHRAEANVQSDLHTLLSAAPLNLDDDDLNNITLEAQAGERRRIDVEVGFTVFEVKRDLRVGNVRTEAVQQLAGYVRQRTTTMNQRYVGVLTDGCEWQLHHLRGDELEQVSVFTVNASDPDVDGLVLWLEGVLATVEKITPNPKEIDKRLGATSPSHQLDAAELRALYEAHKDLPTVKVKRGLWSRLLTTALGTAFSDEDDLFVDHTLLVAMGEVISHSVVGFHPEDPSISAGTIMSGALFARAQIGGVVEADFFDWIVEVPGGDRFVKSLARRLARFDWAAVEHDVMKTLYESVIPPTTRKKLGEYYTPDWLAEAMVETSVTAPLDQRVFDASCGSGTFLFHAVRRYIAAAEAAGKNNADTITGVTEHVLGVDLHPVAVTLARVTYLLAIGMERLRAGDRPPFAVPVYLGDSLQWGQETTLLAHDGLTVPTSDGATLFADELRFPDRVVADAGRFDRLVSELAEKASSRPQGSPHPSINATLRLFAVHPDDQPVVAQTFKIMCQLHDEGRDHIWGYFVRNLARPIWLARPANRVDVLIGNPPWLPYHSMTPAMQDMFRSMCQARGLWAGRSVATSQDLAGLFVARAVELYLKQGGTFAYVLPWATLSRQPYAGFRSGDFPNPAQPIKVAFGRPWDVHAVKPSFFPVPACVAFGERSAVSAPLTLEPEVWSGRLPHAGATMAQASPKLTREIAGEAIKSGGESVSPYAERFSQGATVVPRMLFIVEPDGAASPLGAGAGRRPIKSLRSPNEKKPWKALPTLTGTVEADFIVPLVTGDALLPFTIRPTNEAVVPWDGRNLMAGTDERIDLYPGLAQWWRSAEKLWAANRSSDRLDLREQLDFRRKLSQQFPAPRFRLVYNASGMYLAAAVVTDQRAVIEHVLYWAAVDSIDEGRFLSAFMNSDAFTLAIRPLQARGEHNPRHFDKYIFQLPIPMFDPADSKHVELVALSAAAEEIAGKVELADVRFEALRRHVRQALLASGVAAQLDALVLDLLGMAGSKP